MTNTSDTGAHADVQPFLRIGDGWSTRQEAARSGRRYVPRGGPIVDFSSVPISRRARKSPSGVDINAKTTKDSTVKANTVRVELSTRCGKSPNPQPTAGLRDSAPATKGASTTGIPPVLTKKKVTFSDQGPTPNQASLSQAHENEIACETTYLLREDSEEGATDELVQQLSKEVQSLGLERQRLRELRLNLSHEQEIFFGERAAWESRKSSSQLRHELEEKERRLERERRVLQKQGRALLKMPIRKEREELAALQAVLEKERQDRRCKDARNKLVEERLKRLLAEAQDANFQLRRRLHELESREEGPRSSVKGSKPSTIAVSKKQHVIAEARQVKRNPPASALVLEVNGSRPAQKLKPCSRELLDRAEQSLEAACSAVENLVIHGRTSTGHDGAGGLLNSTSEQHEPPKAIPSPLEPRQEGSKLRDATIQSSSEDQHATYTFGSGLTAIRFANGDVLQTQEGGVEQYWYSEKDCWQTNYPSGTEVLHHASGLVEASHANGLEERLDPIEGASILSQRVDSGCQPVSRAILSWEALQPRPISLIRLDLH